MTPASTWECVDQAAADIRRRCASLPETAIVLGSGLGDFSDTLLDAVAASYTELPHWPASNVVGHAGRLVIGNVAGKRIAALSGRVHFYEGYDLQAVVFATRVMGRLGVRFDQLNEFVPGLAQFRNVRIDGVMTHLAAADDAACQPLTRDQIQRFQDAVDHFAGPAARACGLPRTSSKKAGKASGTRRAATRATISINIQPAYTNVTP